MARISLLFGFIAIISFSYIINEATARDVKVLKFHDIKQQTLKMLGGEGRLNKEEIANLLKKIKSARNMLKELKAEDKRANDMKDELHFLSKSEALFKEMLKILKTGDVGEKQTSVFIKKVTAFYEAWRQTTYNAAVPEKEKEFMVKMGEIVMYLKETQKNL